MSKIEIITNVIGFFAMAGIFITLIASTVLFFILSKKYPVYYKKNGQPIVFAFEMNASASSLLIRQSKGLGYVLSLVVKGLPATFPKNVLLRRLALTMRYAYGYTLIVFPFLLGMAIYSAIKNH